MAQYTARRMKNNEFRTVDDLIRRDAKGALCQFAVDGGNFAVLNLSWAQACELAESNNAAFEQQQAAYYADLERKLGMTAGDLTGLAVEEIDTMIAEAA